MVLGVRESMQFAAPPRRLIVIEWPVMHLSLFYSPELFGFNGNIHNATSPYAWSSATFSTTLSSLRLTGDTDQFRSTANEVSTQGNLTQTSSTCTDKDYPQRSYINNTIDNGYIRQYSSTVLTPMSIINGYIHYDDVLTSSATGAFGLDVEGTVYLHTF
ncbi:unnamed protein product [Pieris macdunnoughi]|uniref:Uncharacterized protein n=1 Tax=Pieris macdunnoughi TaxID=345717 RepID=A0A821L2K9_9NEOP|nr:unnamed protein product [Pieris macdunnoughi]